MKLKKLKGIANTAVDVGSWREPFGFITPPFKIVVDLVNKRINPDMKGDSVEEFYFEVCNWFHEVLKKEKIPLETIDSAIIEIFPKKRPKCLIKAKGKIYSSDLG